MGSLAADYSIRCGRVSWDSTVCAEADWPHIELLRDFSILRWGQRLFDTAVGHVAGDAFRAAYAAPPPHRDPLFARSLVSQLKEVEQRWGLLHSDGINLADVLRARSFDRWR